MLNGIIKSTEFFKCISRGPFSTVIPVSNFLAIHVVYFQFEIFLLIQQVRLLLLSWPLPM